MFLLRLQLVELRGVLEGNIAVMWPQIASVVATMIYAMVVTFILIKILDATMGLRVDDDQEREGLDTSLHGEHAYQLQ